MTDSTINTTTANVFPCNSCGASLAYKPGTKYLLCCYCGHKSDFGKEWVEAGEIDFNRYIQNYEREHFETAKVIVCNNCGATPKVDEHLKSLSCPYCSSSLVEENACQERYVKPSHLSPFIIDRDKIAPILAKWIGGLWFAPSKLKKTVLSPQNLHGIYIPFWTFDANTITRYTGERGDAYYVTVGTGEKRRRVRRVRWNYVSGTIREYYDDELVIGSQSLNATLVSKVNGWNTRNLMRFDERYLAGFLSEKYQVDLAAAFQIAEQRIREGEKHGVKRDIGGDEQRISSMDVQLSNIKFKHILLPIYISSFRYKDTLYSFYVNGSTGRIAGERPFSALKIVLFMLAILGLILLFSIAAAGSKY